MARTLVIDLNDLDTNPVYEDDAPNVETVGVFRHELGHILGLRHEHTRPDPGTCFEDNSWRAVTVHDQASTMHYPWCNGVITSDLSITPLDRAGARLLYPVNLANVRDADERVDLNDDGRADVCGRAATGVRCALSSGAAFGSQTLWSASFSDANSWNAGPHYYSTIGFPDLDADGGADLCGGGGVSCAFSSGDVRSRESVGDRVLRRERLERGPGVLLDDPVPGPERRRPGRPVRARRRRRTLRPPRRHDVRSGEPLVEHLLQRERLEPGRVLHHHPLPVITERQGSDRGGLETPLINHHR